MRTTAENMEVYELYELGEEAKERAFRDFMENRENDPYFGQYFADTYEREIWDAVRDLESSIRGARVKWHYNRWYSADFDVEYSYSDCYSPDELEPVEDNGYCHSMDVCDAWNAHIKALNAIYERFELLGRYMEETAESFDYWNGHTAADRVYNRLSDMSDDLETRWYKELENACNDVRMTIETLLRDEWEWYTGAEYALAEFEDETTQGYMLRTIDHGGRVLLHDCRKWYTVDGELYEQTDINGACVSIVKAA